MMVTIPPFGSTAFFFFFFLFPSETTGTYQGGSGILLDFLSLSWALAGRLRPESSTCAEVVLFHTNKIHQRKKICKNYRPHLWQAALRPNTTVNMHPWLVKSGEEISKDKKAKLALKRTIEKWNWKIIIGLVSMHLYLLSLRNAYMFSVFLCEVKLRSKHSATERPNFLLKKMKRKGKRGKRNESKRERGSSSS